MNRFENQEFVEQPSGLALPNRRIFLTTAATAVGVAAAESTFNIGQLFGAEQDDIKKAEEMKQLAEQAREIETYINKSVIWRTAGDVLGTMREDCADGRGNEHLVGTAGGDMGAIFYELMAVQRVTGKKIKVEDVPRIFQNYLDRRKGKGSFYMHTDGHAIAHLGKEFRLGDENERRPDEKKAVEKAVLELIDNPRGNEERVLHALQDPNNVGCGHLKYLLKESEEYRDSDPEVLRALIREFFKHKWKGEKMDYVVLHGEHQEKAIVDFMSDMEAKLTLDSLVPLVKPNIDDFSVFVLHRQLEELEAWLFAQNASNITGIDNIDRRELLKVMAELRKAWLNASVVNLKADKMHLFTGHYKGKDQPITVAV